MVFSKSIVAAALALASIAACSPKHDEPRDGVNDVREACNIRTSWANSNRDKCINCMIGSRSPACTCEEFKEFAGLCRTQEEARLAEPSCTAAVSDCVKKCAKSATTSDCGCLDGCYASAEACKRVAAASDGCATDVCTELCR